MSGTGVEKYIQSVVDVCDMVFKKTLGIPATVGIPYYIERDWENGWDISGVIGLSGEARGVMVISMKKELALRLTEALTGAKYSEFDDDVLDAVGEIINIIAGRVKQKLENDCNLIIFLPSVITGREHAVTPRHAESGRIMCIPFTALETQVFRLAVVLEPAVSA